MQFNKFFLILIFFGTAAQARVLDIQNWTTQNGAAIYYVNAPQLPIVDIVVAFQAGSARDGQQFGIATLTNGMLNEGAGSLNADQIAAAFDTVGAEYNNRAARDMSLVTLRSLTDPQSLTPALATFTMVLNQPSFPVDALQRVKQQMNTALAARAQNPGTIASDIFYQKIYGDNPYAHVPMGTAQTLSAIDQADLINFYKSYYVGKNTTVVIVGNVSVAQAHQIAEQVVGQLPSGKAAAALPSIPKNSSSLTQINYPSEQTHVRIGEIAINWQDPDRIPLLVGNYILGGGGSFVSRLFLEVRQKHGLSYGVSSHVQPLASNGEFVIQLQTKNATAKEATDYATQVLKDFVANGPTPAELKAAKENLIGGFPLQLDSNANIATAVLIIGFYHLPLNDLDTFRDRVNAVTAEQIKAAFQRQINLNDLAIVTVGKATHG